MLAELREHFAQAAFSARCSSLATGMSFEPLSALLRQLHAANLLSNEWLELADHPGAVVDLRDALATAASRRPIALLVDDLHSAGEAALSAFEYCVDRLVDYPIRWFVTASPGHAATTAVLARLESKHLLEAFPLEPLSGDEARALLASLAPLIGGGAQAQLGVDERWVATALAVADTPRSTSIAGSRCRHQHGSRATRASRVGSRSHRSSRTTRLCRRFAADARLRRFRQRSVLAAYP